MGVNHNNSGSVELNKSILNGAAPIGAAIAVHKEMGTAIEIRPDKLLAEMMANPNIKLANRINFEKIEADELEPYRVIKSNMQAMKQESYVEERVTTDGKTYTVTLTRSVPDHETRRKAAMDYLMLVGLDPRRERVIVQQNNYGPNGGGGPLSLGESMRSIIDMATSGDGEDAMERYAEIKAAMMRGEVHSVIDGDFKVEETDAPRSTEAPQDTPLQEKKEASVYDNLPPEKF